MELVHFGSWPEVMAYAHRGLPLYYQAPMDHRATRFLPNVNQTFGYEARGRTIRMWPPGSTGRGRNRTADPFNADSGHLDRFSHPAENKVESSGVVRESKRQPSLPGFPDIPDNMDVKIPNMPMWEQIGGDMNPSQHGGLIARSDESSLGEQIELLEIQPVREHVGDKEAAEVGFPFWTKEAYYTLEDLDLKSKDVQSALRSSGFDAGDQKSWFEEEATPEQRALAIAEALFSYGYKTEEGSSGWASDLPDYQVKWMSGEVAPLQTYIADEDDEFKNDVLGYDEIRSNIEAEVQKMVDESAAQGWSQLDDQTMIDLDDQGYDGQSAFVIGVFGNEPMIAVNTETTFGSDFARELGVPIPANGVLIWSETGTRELERWLKKNGYETTDRGGDVPSVEAFATARFVIEAVAREMDLDKDVIEDAAKGIDWWPTDRGHGDQEIAGSSDGETTVWAKKVESEEEPEDEAQEMGGVVRSGRHAGARRAVERLPVLFRAEKSGDARGEVTAVFPTLPGSSAHDFTVYAHNGQHSSGTRGWYNQTRAATPAEYASLLAEIRRIYEHGPNAVQLEVVERFTRHHDTERQRNAR